MAVADPDTLGQKPQPPPNPVVTTPLRPGHFKEAQSHENVATEVAAKQHQAMQLCLAGANALDHAKSETLAQVHQACKEQSLGGGSGPGMMAMVYDPNLSNCVDSSLTVCASPDVRRVARVLFSTTASTPLTVKTFGLTPISGSTPDTVMYLMRCIDQACTNGEIVGIDDDGNSDTPAPPPGGAYDGLGSKITVTSPAPGLWAVVVVAYSQGRHGVATIDVSQPGGYNNSFPGQVFGGWHIPAKEVRTGDVLLTAKNPGSPSMTTPGYATYHDSVIFVASTSSYACAGSCGKFQFQDDTYFGSAAPTYQTRMQVGAALGSPSTARIVVGVYGNGQASNEYFRMNARFLHVRSSASHGGSWTGSGQADLDSDGLTTEIEAQLGTCDAAPSNPNPSGGADLLVAGNGCNATRDWVNEQVDKFDAASAAAPTCASNPSQSKCCSANPTQTKCWSPVDSDNDGIADAAEVFALAVSCDAGPAGPFRHATNCANPNPVYGSCDSGDWCTVEPDDSGAATSPYFDHDPTVFDVYVKADYYTSATCPHGAGSHTLDATRLDSLARMWTDDAFTCWNGDPGGCPAGDLQYRVRLHAYEGSGLAVGDDRFQEELPTGEGAIFSQSHAYARFGGAMRYAGAGRYGLAIHGSQSRGEYMGRHFLWEHDLQGEGYERSTFAHELGHSLGLVHYHRDATEDCSNDSTCISGNPTASWQATPIPATAMSYQYDLSGTFPKQNAGPTATDGYTSGTNARCRRDNLRFSKGLLPNVNEQSVAEQLGVGNGWADWHVRYLAQQMFCYNSMNQPPDSRVLVFALRDANGIPASGPYTIGSLYSTLGYFNWRQRAAAQSFSDLSPTPVSADLTGGKWDSTSTAADQDVLKDVNEWAKMIAVHRSLLGEESNHDMCLYSTTFNGAVTTDDYSGSGESVVATNVTAGQVNYPVGGCGSAGSCSWTGTCRTDSCGGNGDCRQASTGCLAEHVCGCNQDTDCWSGACVAGRCVTAWGGCTCNPNYGATGGCKGPGNVCVATPGNPDYAGYCRNIRVAGAATGELTDPFALLDSVEFNGTNARISLPTSTNTRLNAIPYNNAFMFRADFRFDGFASGQTSQYLVKSGAFWLKVATVGGVTQLQASAIQAPWLTFNGIEKGRWYRVEWGASSAGSDGHFLHVRPWNVLDGSYLPASGAADCVFQPWSFPMPPPGTVYLGHDGTVDPGVYFHGRMDNVSLLDYLYTNRPAACSQQ